MVKLGSLRQTFELDGEWEVGGGPGVVLESRSGEEEASGAAVVVWASKSDEQEASGGVVVV